MNAATPPRRWASAMTCWQTVVLPDDSGPKISVIRPRGMPPTPSARSRAIEPVGMKSTCCRAVAPSFMIEPVPNCFSIERIAASTALPRSAWARSAARSVPPVRSPFRSSAGRCPVIAISSRSCRHNCHSDRPCHWPRAGDQPSSVSSSTGFGFRGFRISSACCGGGSESADSLGWAEL